MPPRIAHTLSTTAEYRSTRDVGWLRESERLRYGGLRGAGCAGAFLLVVNHAAAVVVVDDVVVVVVVVAVAVFVAVTRRGG